MNLNEYLFKTSESLLRRILMYINIDSNHELSNIKNNNEINIDVDNYEWALISILLLMSEKYRRGIKLEEFLTDEDIEEIENLLSESDEILPYDDPLQTQNCILDNNNNTIATFNYLINGTFDDFYLEELENYGTFYEENAFLNYEHQNIEKDKQILKELKDLRNTLLGQQNEANKANNLIISNGKLNTRNFVEWLRNALAHSHYVPYNNRQLRLFIKGKSSDENYRFNAIIDKEIIAKIIDMVYVRAYTDIPNSDISIFETFVREINEDMNDAKFWIDENLEVSIFFSKYFEQIDNCKNIKEIRKTLRNFINELPQNDYFYKESEVKEIINQLLTKNGITFKEIQSEILDYFNEIIDIIKENNVFRDNANFGWLYECKSAAEFEREFIEYLTVDLGIESLNSEMCQRVLSIARKNPEYNKNESCNENKIRIICNIINKMIQLQDSIEILLKINDINTKIRSKKIDWEDYKLLIMALLKCSFLDGYNINDNNFFENIDLSSFKIDDKVKKEYETAMKILNEKKVKKLNEKHQRLEEQLKKQEAAIKKREEELNNKKIDNDYYMVKLPQIIDKLKLEYAQALLQYQNDKQNILSIDALNNEIYASKNINPYIMRHLRNSIAHGNVNIISQGSKNISKTIIAFQDLDKDNGNKSTFAGKIELVDLLEIIASDEFKRTVFNISTNNSMKTK